MLSWALRHGKHERFLERLAQQKGVHGADKAAETLTTRPTLHQDLQDVWHAWHYLSMTRTAGFAAVNAIPLADMVAWLDVHGVPVRWRPWWVRLLLAMDATYLQHARRPANGDAGDGPGSERDPARGGGG